MSRTNEPSQAEPGRELAVAVGPLSSGEIVAAPENAAPWGEEALDAAKPAVGTGATPFVAQLIALALVCLGVVGVQEALVRWGVVTGPSWTSAALREVDGLRYDDVWVLVGGIVAVLVALVLLRVALRRRPRRGVPVAAFTGVDLRTQDVERLAHELLSGPGVVTSARVSASRRRVRAEVTSGATPDMSEAVADDVRTRLAPLLEALARTPRLRVKVRKPQV